MEHWTTKIDLIEAVAVAEIVGVDWRSCHSQRDLIETVAVKLMKCIREPWLLQSPGYNRAVDFYQMCHRAVSALWAGAWDWELGAGRWALEPKSRNLTERSSCLGCANG